MVTRLAPETTAPERKPPLYGLPPGADFPEALARGLLKRYADGPAEVFARVRVLVNSRLLQTRLRQALSEDGARLLPRIGVLSDLGATSILPDRAAPVSALRRKLELRRLVAQLLRVAPDTAPLSSAWALTDSLTELLDEMQAEAVPFEALERIDTSDLAVHWERRLSFLRIVAPLLAPEADRDPGARQALAVAQQIREWTDRVPDHPVVLAGSTGSRATTFDLMAAVAGLPLGAVVLPGFDFEMPQTAWEAVAEGSEDHPQFRAAAFCGRLGLAPAEVRPWVDGTVTAPVAARNRLCSLALRPPPVTDQWLEDGPGLQPFGAATADLTLLEAADPRQEALAIALVLREAAANQRRAVLVTPDRLLARRVIAALDRWGILPDDSAGRPLGLSAPGRLLRQLVAMAGTRPTPQAVVSLLRHPLVHSGQDRGRHLLHTRDLDLALRRKGPALSDPAALQSWAVAQDASLWGAWLAEAAATIGNWPDGALSEHLERHVALAEMLAHGAEADTGSSGDLWEEEAGARAAGLIQALRTEADAGGSMAARDYATLFEGLIAGEAVRDTATPDPRIAIRGPVEARAIRADLWVLGGLNDGVWPELPGADPWLNRRMRAEAGLLSPERRIGLAAHDFQMGLAGKEVVLTRALRDGESETVPSRWLNRLLALLKGLEPAGPDSLTAMRDRARVWIEAARSLDRPARRSDPAPRPAPAPPVSARPTELPVTAITTLIRDPYAVYARHVLRLYPLDPLWRDADARLRGEVLHKVMERLAISDPPVTTLDQALTVAEEILNERVPWDAARLLWKTRFARIAPDILAGQATRAGVPLRVERTGRALVGATGVTLTARPDRIDREADSRLRIIDYKTGEIPSENMIRHFEKQMPLEVALAARGGFEGLDGTLAGYLLIRIGADYAERCVDMTSADIEPAWSELEQLITSYMRPAQGYSAARAPHSERFKGDYEHLARRGEWDRHDPPVTLMVGSHSDSTR